MENYWESFASKYKNSIIFSWSIAKTLEEYTKWLSIQEGSNDMMDFLRDEQKADNNYEG